MFHSNRNLQKMSEIDYQIDRKIRIISNFKNRCAVVKNFTNKQKRVIQLVFIHLQLTIPENQFEI